MGNPSNNISIIGNILYDSYMLKFSQQKRYVVPITYLRLMLCAPSLYLFFFVVKILTLIAREKHRNVRL